MRLAGLYSTYTLASLSSELLLFSFVFRYILATRSVGIRVGSSRVSGAGLAPALAVESATTVSLHVSCGVALVTARFTPT